MIVFLAPKFRCCAYTISPVEDILFDDYTSIYETPYPHAKVGRYGSTRGVGLHPGHIFSPAWRARTKLSQAHDEALGRPGRTDLSRAWSVRKSACPLHAERCARRTHPLLTSPRTHVCESGVQVVRGRSDLSGRDDFDVHDHRLSRSFRHSLGSDRVHPYRSPRGARNRCAHER